MTPLPILKSSPSSAPEQMVRLFHQSQLEWARHLGSETELDFGRWISNADLPHSPVANCLLDVRLLPGQPAADLLAQLAALFKGIPPQCCVLNPSMLPEQTSALRDALLSDGWKAEFNDILYCTKLASQPGSIEEVKIIPARAGFNHYRQLMSQRSEAQTDAALLHLDDSHFDVLLAVKEGKGVGSIGVLTSGETGTIREWFVLPSYRNKRIGGLLLNRALEIAARGLLRHVMIGLPAASSNASLISKKAEFSKIGQWESFWKDSCKSSRIFA